MLTRKPTNQEILDEIYKTVGNNYAHIRKLLEGIYDIPSARDDSFYKALNMYEWIMFLYTARIKRESNKIRIKQPDDLKKIIAQYIEEGFKMTHKSRYNGKVNEKLNPYKYSTLEERLLEIPVTTHEKIYNDIKKPPTKYANEKEYDYMKYIFRDTYDVIFFPENTKKQMTKKIIEIIKELTTQIIENEKYIRNYRKQIKLF